MGVYVGVYWGVYRYDTYPVGDGLDTDGGVPSGFDEDVMEVVYVWYVV